MIVKYPISTEKVVRMMQQENKLAFIVDKKAKKNNIKNEIEKMFKVKIIGIKTFVTSQGIKKVYIKLAKENSAMDVATQLGLM
ncbi:MAG: 50S ribosomal protein L23 [Nanoarchaeota archaeon]